MQVLALARKEADRLNHNFLGTEHLLLGLIELGQGVAVNVLAKLGLDLETVRQEVEKQVGTGPDQKMIGNIPYTPRVKKVIALAQKEARRLNHTYVGTEHLLLGLLREGDGIAAKVLRALEVNLEQTRTEILRELDPNFEVERLDEQTPSSSKENVATKPRFEMPQEAVPGETMGELSQFTPRAQQTLALAAKEAVRLNHSFVGTEHVLLGLIKLGQGMAVNVLVEMGLDLDELRREIEQAVGTGAGQTVTGVPPPTPRVRRVLKLADREKERMGHTYLDTEHILLGLLAEGDGVAAKVLRARGVELEQTRAEILRELDPNFEANRIEKTNQPAKQTTAMQTPPETPHDPNPASGPPNPVGASKRYDVYCTERGTELVVYRNAIFKGIKRLLNSSQNDAMGQFIELEQADGQTIFISRFSIIKFCEPGTTPGGETIAPAKR